MGLGVECVDGGGVIDVFFFFLVVGILGLLLPHCSTCHDYAFDCGWVE